MSGFNLLEYLQGLNWDRLHHGIGVLWTPVRRSCAKFADDNDDFTKLLLCTRCGITVPLAMFLFCGRDLADGQEGRPIEPGSIFTIEIDDSHRAFGYYDGIGYIIIESYYDLNYLPKTDEDWQKISHTCVYLLEDNISDIPDGYMRIYPSAPTINIKDINDRAVFLDKMADILDDRLARDKFIKHQ